MDTMSEEEEEEQEDEELEGLTRVDEGDRQRSWLRLLIKA